MPLQLHSTPNGASLDKVSCIKMPAALVTIWILWCSTAWFSYKTLSPFHSYKWPLLQVCFKVHCRLWGIFCFRAVLLVIQPDVVAPEMGAIDCCSTQEQMWVSGPWGDSFRGIFLAAGEPKMPSLTAREASKCSNFSFSLHICVLYRGS